MIRRILSALDTENPDNATYDRAVMVTTTILAALIATLIAVAYLTA